MSQKEHMGGYGFRHLLVVVSSYVVLNGHVLLLLLLLLLFTGRIFVLLFLLPVPYVPMERAGVLLKLQLKLKQYIFSILRRPPPSIQMISWTWMDLTFVPFYSAQSVSYSFKMISWTWIMSAQKHLS
jgi:hypothetical protein